MSEHPPADATADLTRAAVNCDPALPHRLRDRGGAGHGAGDLVGVGGLGEHRARRRPGLRVRLRPHGRPGGAGWARRCARRSGWRSPPTPCSILVMEVVDNGVLLVVPGAMDAGLLDALFWGSLAFALLVAFVVTVPVNRAMIARGRGHAVGPRVPPLTVRPGRARLRRPVRWQAVDRGDHPVTSQPRTERGRSLPAALLGALAVLAALFVVPGGQATVAPSPSFGPAATVRGTAPLGAGLRENRDQARIVPRRGTRTERAAAAAQDGRHRGRARTGAGRRAGCRRHAGGAGRRGGRRRAPDRPAPVICRERVATAHLPRSHSPDPRPHTTRSRRPRPRRSPAASSASSPTAAAHRRRRDPPEAPRVPSTTRPRPDRPRHRRGLALRRRHHTRPPRSRPARRHPDRPGDPGLADRQGRRRVHRPRPRGAAPPGRRARRRRADA